MTECAGMRRFYFYCMNRVNGESVVLVGDFGLARDVYAQGYYRHNPSSRLPVKWMPPETLNDGISNEKTDVVSHEQGKSTHNAEKVYTVVVRLVFSKVTNSLMVLRADILKVGQASLHVHVVHHAQLVD